jgi:hypothetical protein
MEKRNYKNCGIERVISPFSNASNIPKIPMKNSPSISYGNGNGILYI